MRRLPYCAVVCAWLVAGAVPLATVYSAAPADVLLETMQRELHRAAEALGKADPGTYYLSYSVSDATAATIVGSTGSLVVSSEDHRRQADVMMRVGSPALDNTHGQSRPSGIVSGSFRLSDDRDAIARVLWQLTDREYEQASQAFVKVKTNQAVQSAEEDKSPDFSAKPPKTHVDEAQPQVSFDRKAWEDRIRRLSGGLLEVSGCVWFQPSICSLRPAVPISRPAKEPLWCSPRPSAAW